MPTPEQKNPTRRDFGRGTCVTCGNVYALRASGTVRNHLRYKVWGRPMPGEKWCPGTGKMPKEFEDALVST